MNKMKSLTCSKKTLSILAILTRLIVASHFIYELQDKIFRYNHWKDIILNDAGLG